FLALPAQKALERIAQTRREPGDELRGRRRVDPGALRVKRVHELPLLLGEGAGFPRAMEGHEVADPVRGGEARVDESVCVAGSPHLLDVRRAVPVALGEEVAARAGEERSRELPRQRLERRVSPESLSVAHVAPKVIAFAGVAEADVERVADPHPD